MTDLSQVSDADLLSSLPRGVRNNNPLNLKATVNWAGMKAKDGDFAVFDTPEAGAAAADKNLQAYATKHGLNTVSGVVGRWAPPHADGNHTAAYVRHVSDRLGVDPNHPLDMQKPEVRQALIGAMGEFENGVPVTAPAPHGDLAGVSDAELMASLGAPQGPVTGSSHNGGVTAEVLPAQPAAAPQAFRRDQGLGFQKGAVKPWDNAAIWAEGGLKRLGVPTDAINHALGMPSAAAAAGSHAAAVKAREARGVKPGRMGEFVGNVAGALPLSLMPGGVMAQGAASGALLSDNPQDAGGVFRDAVVGGVAGKVGDKAIKGLGNLASDVFAKAPKVMRLPELEAAKRAAYDAVDKSGFAFPQTDIAAMADDFAKTMSSSALSKSAKEDARSIITYTRSLAKGDLPISQLEKLRGDIYSAMVEKGGDTAKLGSAFRAKIDALIDSTDNGLVRAARDLNTRYKKADLVTRASQTADIQSEKDYGGDYGRKLKNRLFPLIDPSNQNRNLRGASADEKAAIERIVRGTKLQNVASTVGGMLDPRRMGGKIMSGMTTTGGGAGAPLTGGLSLLVPAAQMAAGFGLTGAASRTARQNLDDLVRLIAAGGSRQALKKAPTAASQAVQTATAKARLASGLIGAAAASQARGQPANRKP